MCSSDKRPSGIILRKRGEARGAAAAAEEEDEDEEEEETGDTEVVVSG